MVDWALAQRVAVGALILKPAPATYRSRDLQGQFDDLTARARIRDAAIRLFAERGWPAIDVTRRSIEETAAAVLDLYRAHRLQFIAEG